MKKKIVLLVTAFLVTIAKGEVKLFSYGTNGSIVNLSSKLIQPFEWESDINLVSVEEFPLKVYDGKEYKLKLQKYPVSDSEGMFNQIQILLNSKELLTLSNMDVWEKTHYFSMKYYIQVPLSSTSMALCFIGHNYDVMPPLLTIVVVNKDHASLVYNQGGFILSCTNTSNEFSIVYTDEFQEGNEDGSLSPLTSKVKKWKIWRDGDMLKYAQIK